MKERIETPVFVVFISIALLFSCFTFVLGIWICDSSHQIDKQLSQMKIVEKDTLDMNAGENEYPYKEEEVSYSYNPDDSNNDQIDQENSGLSEEMLPESEESIKKKKNNSSSASEFSDKSNENIADTQISQKENEKKSDITDKEKSPVKTVQSEKTSESSQPSVKEPDKQTSPKSKLYYIQIIATSSKTTAEKTKQRLEKKGYNVYLITDTKSNQTLYKIRVGTFRTRAQAMKIASKIEKEEKIKPWVL